METCRYYNLNKELREEVTVLRARVLRLNKEITIRDIPESALRQKYRRVRHENDECRTFAKKMEQKMFRNLKLFRSEQRFAMKLKKTNKELFERSVRTERKIDELLHTDREKKIAKLNEMYYRLSKDFNLYYKTADNQSKIIFVLKKKIRDQEKQIKDLNIKISYISEKLSTYSH